MGAKLGHPTLPLGCHADPRSGLVAVASARRPENLSCVPDRSRPGVLSNLCFSLAADTKQGIPAALLGRHAGTDRRQLSAILSARRLDLGELRNEPARG